MGRRRAPGSGRGPGSDAPARAVPSEPSPRRFAPRRLRQPTSQGALPRRTAFEVPPCPKRPPLRGFALRDRAGFRDPGAAARPRAGCTASSRRIVGCERALGAFGVGEQGRRGVELTGSRGSLALDHPPPRLAPSRAQLSFRRRMGSEAPHRIALDMRSAGRVGESALPSAVWHRDLFVVAMRSCKLRGVLFTRGLPSFCTHLSGAPRASRSEQLSSLSQTPGCASIPVVRSADTRRSWTRTQPVPSLPLPGVTQERPRRHSGHACSYPVP